MLKDLDRRLPRFVFDFVCAAGLVTHPLYGIYGLLIIDCWGMMNVARLKRITTIADWSIVLGREPPPSCSAVLRLTGMLPTMGLMDVPF